MPIALRTPRINNNDDTVRLTSILVETGAAVHKGQSLAEIETDKATFDVEAEQDGYVLAILHQPGETVDVGSVLFWLGATPDEARTRSNGRHDQYPKHRFLREPSLP